MSSTPQIAKRAPDFSGMALVNGAFKKVCLDDFAGKYLVLFFYPMDFTFVCPTEINLFSDRVKEFNDIGCEVVGCSTDTEYSHLAWTKLSRHAGGLGETKIPLLADKTHAIARAYGVLKEDDGTAFRGLFIIDEKGILRHMTINDMPVGRSVDEAKRVVEAFQFVDKHGEVCPVNWKPGKASIKPDSKKSASFFTETYHLDGPMEGSK